ncbi:alpha/beta fold hydrolase [Kitasatospora kifunensis]|uniref:Pimeloyl-ACP methyl ester carboxylesterase n=1 Tax=Kitasatospora kifunensis TaxID=58351 RepID=A0A7W7VW09_KITKI|nr:alpha/beta hydrolase [Kitasatospora kifunensis]MBB4924224.1 pimeloyl-ACP methyl ester carboxylesterase [Kitasatospora kifunensis]
MSYAKVNGIELFYERTGAGDPVLFLHGWGTSGRVWGAQVADLAADHQVITVDWRGCGRSDHPATGNTAADNVADLLALINHLELDRPVLVGSSIGATFALEAALAEPQLVGGVVSVDGPGYWPSQGMTEQLRALTDNLAADRAGTLAGWIPGWFGPAASPALVDWTVRQALDSGVFIDALFAEAAAYDPRPRMAALTVPAVFLHGRLDSEIPLAVSETLAALVPHGSLQAIEGAGHMPQQELPREFNLALRAALERIAAGRIAAAAR